MKAKHVLLAIGAFLCVGACLLLTFEPGCRYRWVPTVEGSDWKVEQYHVDNPFWCRR